MGWLVVPVPVPVPVLVPVPQKQEVGKYTEVQTIRKVYQSS